MNFLRLAAEALQVQDGKLLVTGGTKPGYPFNSTEMLTKDGWESKIPTLPVTIAEHCMVLVNSSTVIAIGGGQNGQVSGKTFYFTFGEENWIEGPVLKYKRRSQSCGMIRRNKDSQEMSIIVAGGYDGASFLTSVEILDEGSNVWRTGPELSETIWISQMVQDQNGGVIMIGGASPSNDYLDTLLQLPHGVAMWTSMEQKLKIGRHVHIAFLVPDDSVDCSRSN
jgi:hypothetical protein